MMRSVLVIGLFGLLLFCSTLVSSSTVQVQDADDVALMELGIDLSHSTTTTMPPPLPTYVTTKPAGHEAAMIAKFPLVHEIEGIEKQDWSDIQGLLFREPKVAEESSLDMKLDELEKEFNRVDSMPIPSPIPPPGSTLLPKIKKVEEGLRATLPKKMKLKQIQAAPKSKNKDAKKLKVKSAAPAKPASTPAAAPATKPAAKPASTKPSKPAQKAADPKPAKDAENGAAATVATVKLIDKRIRGLSLLFKRLKHQMGMAPKKGEKAIKSSADRLKAALAKHKKDRKELKRRMAAKASKAKARFAQVDLDEQTDAEAEAEQEALQEAEAESFAETDADADSDADSEVESDQQAETELQLDAEAVDEILDTLM